MHSVTGDSVDPRYADPVIEVNEERADPEPHRYVHGSFKGTAGKFSFYFPAKARYQGRFFHNTYPLIADADAGPSPIDFKINEGSVGFAFDSGGYFVQTNQGAGADRASKDPSISSGYRLNAAAAKLSRVIAAEVYGKIARPYGYIHGGSGGSKQVMGCAENTSGVWDGFLPYVLGSNHSLSFLTNVIAHTHRVLSARNKFPDVMDALDPGGSGDPYATLNAEERGALREATLMGFPLRGWWQHGAMGGFSLSADAFDPTYTADFWSKPGYLGTDPTSTIRAARLQAETTIAKVNPGTPATIELASVPDRDLRGCQFIVTSGAAAGTVLPVGRIAGKTLTLGYIAGLAGLPGAFLPVPAPNVQPGDAVRIDNSGPLAFQTYYRHHLPASTEYYAWNQFRGPDGTPLYPQRPTQPPLGAIATIGALVEGRVTGKVLVMEAMMDIHAWPWQADWYRGKIKAALGPKFDDTFALWFIDNAQHDVPGHFGTQGMAKQAWARTVSPVGALQQGLRDLAAWCETGVKPAETNYEIVDTQVHLPVSAIARGGIQPIVTLTANGAVRAAVKVNAAVKFAGTIEVPPKAGKVVAVAWDFEGTGDRAPEPVPVPAAQVTVTGQHTYAKPGTYFAVLRAFSHRDGDANAPFAQVENLARVRVVVA